MIKSFFTKKFKWDYGKKAKKIEKKWKKMEKIPVLAPFSGVSGILCSKSPKNHTKIHFTSSTINPLPSSIRSSRSY